MKKKMMIRLTASGIMMLLIAGCNNQTTIQNAETLSDLESQISLNNKFTVVTDSDPETVSEESISESSSQMEEEKNEVVSNDSEKLPLGGTEGESLEAIDSSETQETADSFVEKMPEESYEEGILTEDACATISPKEMYASLDLNLRQGPGTEYEKIGRLTKGDKVVVTGITESGWCYLQSGEYASGRYLSEEPPKDSSCQVPQGLASSSQTSEAPMQTGEQVASADDFVNKVNAQRAALGLPELKADTEMTEYAKKRAKEISGNFSHDGFTGYSGENIGNFSYSDINKWYETFYESLGHRENMLNANYEKTGAAVYFNGREYFVVQIFQHYPVTYDSQEQIQQAVNETQEANLLPAGQSEGGMTQSYTSSGDVVNPGDDSYEDLSAAADSLLEEWYAQHGK